MWGSHHPGESDPGPPQPKPPPAQWGYRKERGRLRGVALGLPAFGSGSVAKVGTRFAGLLIDFLIVLPWIALTSLFMHRHFVTLTRADGTTHQRLVSDRPMTALAIAFLLPPIVYTIGLIATRGRTIGEQAMGLRVVRVGDLVPVFEGDDPEARPTARPGWPASILRWLVIGWVSIVGAFTNAFSGWLLLVPIVVLLWACWDDDGQGLHDKAANVVVLTTR
jgi:uncharacterized RDD family membrane protein YckC